MKYPSHIRRMRFIIISVVSLLITGCIDPVDIDTEDFEDLLVIEANLTTENIKHKIQISRSFDFENTSATKESGANVRIIDNQNNTYSFTEIAAGVYESTAAFVPSIANTYQLRVTTANGNSYTSDFVQPSRPFNIQKVYAEPTINDNDAFGLGVFVDSANSPDQNVYVKYEFDETTKLLPPFWTDLTAIPANNQKGYEVIPKDPSIKDRICYLTESSNTIILANTEKQLVNTLKGIKIRFLNVTDFRLRSRYSINVKQISQSRSTYKFYELLSKLSDPDNIFSQLQPGFIQGNIVSETNKEEKVAGLFSISSVAYQRIFVDFKDFFPNQQRPNYIANCGIEVLKPNLAVYSEQLENGDNLPGLVSMVINGIYQELESSFQSDFSFLTETSFSHPKTGLTLIEALPIFVPTDCADCRRFGSNIKPDFWED